MYYQLISQTKTGKDVTDFDFASSMGRAFVKAETFLEANPTLEVLIYEVSEENLEDVDCNAWSSEEMRDRRRCVRHLVYDDGVQDA
jgi:hypothetical protein